MQNKDLHTHTIYSDGKNSPEEMVSSAINKGLSVLGISDHSYTFFDESYCIPKDKITEYKTVINSLKEKYKGRITLLCGIEQDYYSEESTTDYDYVIGSVHYVRIPARNISSAGRCLLYEDFLYIPVDESADILKDAINSYFNGDALAFAELYFATISDLIKKTKANIIGHFDLLTKFNEHEVIFDTNSPRYISAWKSAVDKLLKTDAIFEINTGAIFRGYRTVPYPSPEIQKYILEQKASANTSPFIYSSDSHNCESISYFANMQC